MQNPIHNQDPDQHHRDNGNVLGDSTARTVEYLRARLLAERSVSRTARERADELAKKVVELEEQLKIVSLQRKKAEKATADVLAILEDRGLSDFSEEIDSSSDHELDNFESNMESDFQEESLNFSKIDRNHGDDLSGSEIETSSLPGRSLSWKSGKDSPNSGRKKYINSNNRSPFASPPLSSPRRSAGGKSCRRIRQRENRSADEEPLNGSIQAVTENGDAACTEGGSNNSGNAPEIPGNSSENQNLDTEVEGSGDLETQPDISNHLNLDNSSREMERALEHQAQLIGQYEEEEKAQEEWENKFRENNSSVVSCEREITRSDITKERDEFKSVSAPNPVRGNDSVDLKPKSNVQNVQSSSVSKLRDHQPSPLQPDVRRNTNTIPVSVSKVENISPDVGSVLQALQQAKLSLSNKLRASSPSNGVSRRKAIEFPVKDRPEVLLGCDALFRTPSDFNPLASDSRLSLTNYPHKGTSINSADQFIPTHSTDNRFPSIDPQLGPSLDRARFNPNNFKNSDLDLNADPRPRFDRDVPFHSSYMYNGPIMDRSSVHSSYISPSYPSNTDPVLRRPYSGKDQFSSTNISRVPAQSPYGGEHQYSSVDRNHIPIRSPYGGEHQYPIMDRNPVPTQSPYGGDPQYSSTDRNRVPVQSSYGGDPQYSSTDRNRVPVQSSYGGDPQYSSTDRNRVPVQSSYGGDPQYSSTDRNRVPVQSSYGGEQPFTSMDRNHFPVRSFSGGERPFPGAGMNSFPSPYASSSYPLYGDPMLQKPSGREGLFSSTGTGVGRPDPSFYDRTRPDMYR